MNDELDFNKIDAFLSRFSSDGSSNEPRAIVVPLDGSEIVIEPDRTMPYEHGTNLLNALSRLSELDERIGSYDAELSQIHDAKEALRREFAVKMSALTEREAAIEEELRPDKRERRVLAQEIQRFENLLREAIASERVKEEYKRKSWEYDQLTASCFWREFALSHQLDGAKYMASAKKIILGDKPGLGKTLTSLITADMVQAKKLLIIVPDDVATNFRNEVTRWAPHRTVIFLAKQPKITRAFVLENLDQFDEFTVIVNYSAWRRDEQLITRLSELRFEMVIIDEAHIVKNIKTNAYLGCRTIILAENSCPKCRGPITRKDTPREFLEGIDDYRVYRYEKTMRLCDAKNPCGWNELVDLLANVTREPYELCSVRNVVPMTGTPILNKPEDLYAMLSLVDPVHFEPTLAGARDFNYTYCMQDFQGRWMFAPGGLGRLTRNIAGKYIARDRRTAGVVLPKQEVIVHTIELDQDAYPNQTKVIKDLTKFGMLRLKSGDQVPMLLTIELILRKRQANVWPAGIQFKDADGLIVMSVGDEARESIKLDAICTNGDTLDPSGLVPDLTGNGDMVNGERVVVFSQFKEPLKELERRIKAAGIPVVRFDGDTPEYIKDMVKTDFDRKYCDAPNYEKQWQVCLANYKTGGVGLNLNGATQTIILDEEWNPGKEEQAFNRTDRIGQTEENQVHILRIERTIDDWMANLIAGKRDMTARFETESKTIQQQFLEGLDSGEML